MYADFISSEMLICMIFSPSAMGSFRAPFRMHFYGLSTPVLAPMFWD